MQQALQTGQRIVIDLDFEACMTEPEIRSLCQQLIYCYSYNLNATTPCNLVLASFQGKIAEQLARQASGFEQWKISAQPEPLADLGLDLKYDPAGSACTVHGCLCRSMWLSCSCARNATPPQIQCSIPLVLRHPA